MPQKTFDHLYEVGDISKIYPFKDDKDLFVDVRITLIHYRCTDTEDEVRYDIDHVDEELQAEHGSYKDFAEHRLNNPNPD